MTTHAQHSDINSACLSIVSRLADVGWCVIPDFINNQQVEVLREQASMAWRDEEFHHAGVGQGPAFSIQPALRNDHVRWLDPTESHNAFTDYFSRMEALRSMVNRNLYLGLFDYEAHLAVYPPGSFYRKHLDQFKGIGLRTLTSTLYLNADWKIADGGQLRLYLNGDSNDKHIDILPEGGTLVCFLSADFHHEVLPAQRQRLSLTGWFRRRAS